MKCILVMVAVLLASGGLIFAQAPAPAPAALTPQVLTRYAELVRAGYELDAQQKLLSDLAKAHSERAAEARQANKAEPAAWEADAAKQLQDKSSALEARLNDVKKERASLEEGHKELSVSLLATTAASITAGYSSAEMTYLDKLQERVQQADQETANLIESSKLCSQQILTNNVAEDINRLTQLMDQNQREMRRLEQDKANMELKKLEFRALRRSGS